MRVEDERQPFAEACEQMQIAEAACALLHPGMRPAQAVLALLEGSQPQAALQLAARLLPKRYVVAWLCQCARGQALAPEARAGAALAERWLRDPVESNRRAAYEYANAGGYASLGTWFAAAVGWADGSLAPAGQAAVSPPEHLTARATVAALNLLAAAQPQDFAERREAYVRQALALLDGAAQ